MPVNRRKRTRRLAGKLANNLFWSGAIIVVVLLADQITKAVAVSRLADGVSVEVLGRFFMFTLVFNKGGALGTNLGSSTYYLISSILILIFVLYYMYVSRDNRWIVWPLALVAGGALGNITDRIRFGRVVDFVDVDFFDIDWFGLQVDRWWTFNVADAAISCGVAFLILIVFFSPTRREGSPSTVTQA